MAGRTPSQQAKIDQEKTRANAVRTLADMTPEERERVLAELNSVNRDVAKRRADQARRGKR